MGFGSSKDTTPRLEDEAPVHQYSGDVVAAALEASKPLKLTFDTPANAHRARYGTEPASRHLSGRLKPQLFLEKSRIDGTLIVKAFGCLFFPPAIFSWTMTWLTFDFHFYYPNLTWLVAGSSVVVVLVALHILIRSHRRGITIRWITSGVVMCAAAYAAGLLLGDMNYLVNLQPYYFIKSLKSYANIKLKDVDGTQLLDAGTVVFAEDTQIMTDMGMSFTMWDTYCVAPLGTGSTASASSGNAGPSMATYDVWVVGKNCCKSADPTFACGSYANRKARSGLRQTNENERVFFRLAVQQAEAAYSIVAKHPIFFYWTEDADVALTGYFNAGFRNWVMALFFQLAITASLVYLMVHSLKYSPAELYMS